MGKSFGERLRERRESLGLSLDDLASEAGVSRAYLWKLEKKPNANPSLELIERLAVGLGTTVSSLLPGVGADLGDVAVPASLEECARHYGLNRKDMLDLARINFRGGHPTNRDDWYQIYLTLSRSSPK